MSPDEILERISRGEVATYPVLLPEGLRAEEVAERLEVDGLAERQAFLSVVHDPEFVASLGLEGDSLEGYLFPETYRFPRGLPPQEIARSMVVEFQNVWREIEPQARRYDFGMRDVVTLASIVEKETGAPQERALIASVFHNRLARRMRLESDPTVIYGIPNFDGNLRRVHLEDAANPYNTYRNPGPPAGPHRQPRRRCPARRGTTRGDGVSLLRLPQRRHPPLLEDLPRARKRRQPLPTPRPQIELARPSKPRRRARAQQAPLITAQCKRRRRAQRGEVCGAERRPEPERERSASARPG